MPMNNRILRPLAVPGVLDFAPGAAAAYSLRNLSLSYAGPVVTVRRSTDSAQADFTATEVSDGTLAGWAGADGFVKTWWDQSGNARHATQATTGYQPQIVGGGVLLTDGGKAAVRFDGSDDYLDCGAILLSEDGPASIFAALKNSDSSGVTGNAGIVSQYAGASVGRCWFAYDSVGRGYNWFGDGIEDLRLESSFISTDMAIVSLVMQSPEDGYLYVNAANYAADAATTAIRAQQNTTIGDSSSTFDGTISEAIIYPSDQTALRTRIEGNLAWYY